MIGIIGIEGMAHFTNAYNIYMLLHSISAAGFPIALSILVSRNRALNNSDNIQNVFRVALALFILLGLVGMLILYFGADLYSNAICMPETANAVRAIAPALLFVCIAGAFRGYFQGFEIMAPTAISQLLESFGKLILGVAFAYIAISMECSSEVAAAFALVGLSTGVLISMLFLLIKHLIFKKTLEFNRVNTSYGEFKKRIIIKDLIVIAFPITLSASVTSITGLADTALITNRLVDSGFSLDASVTLYSCYSNLALPLFNLIPSLIASVSLALIPTLKRAIESG
jgi:stage V sporulation protein B